MPYQNRTLQNERLTFLFSIVGILSFLSLATAAPITSSNNIFNMLFPKTSADAKSSNNLSAFFSTKNINDVANEDGQTLSIPQVIQDVSWIGSGDTVDDSYAGFIFHRKGLPLNASIQSAFLVLKSSETNSTPISVDIYAESDKQPEQFSSSSKPSDRIIGTDVITYTTTKTWRKDEVVLINVTQVIDQALTANPELQSISLIMKNTSSVAKQRRFFYGKSNTIKSPRLFVRYRMNDVRTDSNVTIPPSSTKLPTRIPTSINITPTPYPTITSAQPITAIPTQRLNNCIITGCSGQICSDQEMYTTCEYKDEYACYRNAKCERQSNGKCGWTMDNSLSQCLSSTR
ncbi:hypothetical protein HGA91_03240 [candidate division WWE3 bacterium]|nr:hypothetical protein [candidate division WWE3 bacterium]